MKLGVAMRLDLANEICVEVTGVTSRWLGGVVNALPELHSSALPPLFWVVLGARADKEGPRQQKAGTLGHPGDHCAGESPRPQQALSVGSKLLLR